MIIGTYDITHDGMQYIIDGVKEAKSGKFKGQLVKIGCPAYLTTTNAVVNHFRESEVAKAFTKTDDIEKAYAEALQNLNHLIAEIKSNLL